MGLEILLVVHYSITYFIKRAGILYLSCLDQYITFLKFLADDGTIQSGMQRLQEHPRSQGLFPTPPPWGGGVGKRPWERGCCKKLKIILKKSVFLVGFERRLRLSSETGKVGRRKTAKIVRNKMFGDSP